MRRVRIRIRMARVAVLIAALAALAVSTVSTAALGTMPAGASGATDQQLAQASTLTATDVPPDFAPQIPPDAVTDGLTGRGCRAIRNAVAAQHKAAHAESAFAVADGRASIDSLVAVFPTPTAAKLAYRAYPAASTAACIQSAIQTRVAAAVNDPTTQVAVTVAEVPLVVGDASVAYAVTATVSGAAGTATRSMTIVTLRVGRGLGGFVFANAGGPPPSDQVLAATQAVVAHFKAGTG